MTCNVNSSTIDGFIDNQLPARERMELNAHLMECDDCQSQLQMRQQGKSAIAQMRAPKMSLDFDAKLSAKIDAIEQSQKADSNVIPFFRRFRFPIQAAAASAASVALTIAVLSRMMWSYGPIDDDYLVLDGSIPLIEVGVPGAADSLNQINGNVEGAIVWSDNDIDSFDRFTQVSSGFEQDSCGSTSGEKGCDLSPGLQISALTISTSI